MEWKDSFKVNRDKETIMHVAKVNVLMKY